MSINELTHPYPDFQQGAVINSYQFDANNLATREKVTELIAGIVDSKSGVQAIAPTIPVTNALIVNNAPDIESESFTIIIHEEITGLITINGIDVFEDYEQNMQLNGMKTGYYTFFYSNSIFVLDSYSQKIIKNKADIELALNRIAINTYDLSQVEKKAIQNMRYIIPIDIVNGDISCNLDFVGATTSFNLQLITTVTGDVRVNGKKVYNNLDLSKQIDELKPGVYTMYDFGSFIYVNLDKIEELTTELAKTKELSMNHVITDDDYGYTLTFTTKITDPLITKNVIKFSDANLIENAYVTIVNLSGIPVIIDNGALYPNLDSIPSIIKIPHMRITKILIVKDTSGDPPVDSYTLLSVPIYSIGENTIKVTSDYDTDAEMFTNNIVFDTAQTTSDTSITLGLAYNVINVIVNNALGDYDIILKDIVGRTIDTIHKGEVGVFIQYFYSAYRHDGYTDIKKQSYGTMLPVANSNNLLVNDVPFDGKFDLEITSSITGLITINKNGDGALPLYMEYALTTQVNGIEPGIYNIRKRGSAFFLSC